MASAAAIEYPVRQLIVQTTPFCNINCSYCYLPDRSNPAKFPQAMLRKTVERLFEYQDPATPISWHWHAGEPLSVGHRYFEECHRTVIDALGAHREHVEFQVQTNATNINVQWAKFFREQKYRVGVSIDGPADIHDAHRRTRSGAGTFERVVNGIKMLQGAGVNPDILAVVTKESLDRPLDLLRFFVSLGINNISFNFEEVEGPHHSSSLGQMDADGLLREKVHDFVTALLMERDRYYPDVVIRETDRLFPSIWSGDEVRPLLVSPMYYLTILVDGSVSTFCPELAGAKMVSGERFSIGSITRDSFEEMARRAAASDVYGQIQEGVRHCRSGCEYFNLCGGGCPSNKYFENGDFRSTETLHCRIRNQYVTEAVVDYIVNSEKLTAPLHAQPDLELA